MILYFYKQIHFAEKIAENIRKPFSGLINFYNSLARILQYKKYHFWPDFWYIISPVLVLTVNINRRSHSHPHSEKYLGKQDSPCMRNCFFNTGLPCRRAFCFYKFWERPECPGKCCHETFFKRIKNKNKYSLYQFVPVE